MRWTWKAAAAVALAAVVAQGAATGCRQYVELTPPGQAQASFGAVVFETVCERVGYSHELDVRSRDPQAVVDVAGARYDAVCQTPTAAGAAPAVTDAPKVNVLLQERGDLVTAADLVLPPDLLSPVDDFLRAILPLYDDGTFTKLNSAMGALLAMLAQDQDLAAALARLGGRDGYRPLDAALGLARKVFDYPDIDDVLRSLLKTLDDGGAAHDPFTALLAALHLELATAQPVAAPSDPERTVKLVVPLLFTADPRFGAGAPRLLVRRDDRGIAQVAAANALPAPFVDLDGDGLPDVDAFGRFVDRYGNPIAGYWPFPTKDGSGQSPRDAQGRLLSGGEPVYDYLDLDPTLIAGVLRDGRKLFDADADTALKLLSGASALLGARQAATKSYPLPDGTSTTLAFTGFDTQQAALLELVYAVLQVLGAPNLDATLDATTQLISQHEDIVAWFLATGLGIKDFAKRPEFASAAFPESSTIFEDLLPLLRRLLANEALITDLLNALRDPMVQNLGRIHSYYMTYSDRWDPNQNDINAPPIGGFTRKVDRSQPDSGFNRSLNHRLFHLVHDTDGAVLCSKAGASVQVVGIPLATYDNECELFKVDSLGKFYVQSIAYLKDVNGNVVTDASGVPVRKAAFPMNLKAPLTWVSQATLDSALESESGITGFKTHPTTEALNRVIFSDPTPAFLTNLENDPTCVAGDKLKDAHAGTIIAWEVKAADLNFVPYTNASYDANESLFYQSLRPVIQAFADHEEEGLFLDLVGVLYHHWPSTQAAECTFTDPLSPRYCFGDGGVTYEPLIAAILDPLNASAYPGVSTQTFDLMRILNASAPVLADLKLANGDPARPEIVTTATWLLNAQDGLTYRDGTNQVSYKRLVPTEGIDSYDQGTEGVSAFELLGDAFAAKRQALAAAGALADDWKTSTSTLVDLYLTVDADGKHFSNPRLPAMALAVIPFLRARLAHHDQVGDRTQWLKGGLMQDVVDGMANPVFAALVDLTLALKTDDPARRALYGLIAYLLDETNGAGAFQVALTALADLAQLLVDDLDLTPILRAGGHALDPDLGVAPTGISFLSRARALDQGGVLSPVLRNVWQKFGTGTTPFGTFADAVGDVHRVDPTASGPLAADDYQEVLRQATDFVTADDRGLQRFIEVVQSRKLAR